MSHVTLFALRDHDTPRGAADAIEVRGSRVRRLRRAWGMLARRLVGRFTRPGRFRVASIIMSAQEWTPRHPLDVPEQPFWMEAAWYARPGQFISREAALQAAAQFNAKWLTVGPEDDRQ